MLHTPAPNCVLVIDYAAGHAIAQNAGAIIKTLDEKTFLYGKEDYKNPSILIKRSNNLND